MFSLKFNFTNINPLVADVPIKPPENTRKPSFWWCFRGRGYDVGTLAIRVLSDIYSLTYDIYLFAYHKIDLFIVSTESLKLIRPASPAELAN